MKSKAGFFFRVWMPMALVHFSVSQLIVPLTAAVTAYAADAPGGPGFGVAVLVRLTKLLHLPLVTLALYPREWFPGGWVYLPMGLNSLIWGGGFAWLIRFCRRSAPR